MEHASIPAVPVGNSAVVTGGQEERRYCWVCFATEEDDRSASWVHPCSCRGSTKWVHQLCLQRWVEEKQKGNMTGRVSCPQCNTEYIIVFPNMGPFFLLLDSVDNAVYKICPFVAAGIVVGAIYWTAVTYGAVTVMQVLGHKDGLIAMEHADPIALLIGLPAIPIVLILGKMVRWEDSVLTFLRRHMSKMPLFKYILPSFVDTCGESSSRITADQVPVSDTVSATGILCSALLFPTVATICGNVLYDTIPSNLQRTLLGGITYIALKGCLKIYYKQQLFVRQNKRMILDFVQSETSIPDPSTQSQSPPPAPAASQVQQ